MTNRREFSFFDSQKPLPDTSVVKWDNSVNDTMARLQHEDGESLVKKQ